MSRTGDTPGFRQQSQRKSDDLRLPCWWNTGNTFVWPCQADWDILVFRRNADETFACAQPKNKNVPNIAPSKQSGLSYVEILIATVILVVGLVPALDALRAAMLGGTVTEAYVVDRHRMTGRFEEVLAEPFADLDVAALAAASSTIPSSYSEAPGTPGRVLIYLARYDGDDADSDANPFTGGDEGLLWVRAEVENSQQATETLLSQ